MDEERMRELVQGSWAMVTPMLARVPAIFYPRFWDMDPRTKPLFAGKAVREQGEKLTAMLETMVNGLSDLEQLKPLIKSLAKRHAHFGVVEDMFPHLGAALNETLQQLLEEKFTAEVNTSDLATWFTSLYNDSLKVIIFTCLISNFQATPCHVFVRLPFLLTKLLDMLVTLADIMDPG